jgi:hypothetical protein
MDVQEIVGATGCVKHSLDVLARLEKVSASERVSCEDLERASKQAQEEYLRSLQFPSVCRLTAEHFATLDGRGFCNAAVKNALQGARGHGNFTFRVMSKTAAISAMHDHKSSAVRFIYLQGILNRDWFLHHDSSRVTPAEMQEPESEWSHVVLVDVQAQHAYCTNYDHPLRVGHIYPHSGPPYIKIRKCYEISFFPRGGSRFGHLECVSSDDDDDDCPSAASSSSDSDASTSSSSSSDSDASSSSSSSSDSDADAPTIVAPTITEPKLTQEAAKMIDAMAMQYTTGISKSHYMSEGGAGVADIKVLSMNMPPHRHVLLESKAMHFWLVAHHMWLPQYAEIMYNMLMEEDRSTWRDPKTIVKVLHAVREQYNTDDARTMLENKNLRSGQYAGCTGPEKVCDWLVTPKKVRLLIKVGDTLATQAQLAMAHPSVFYSKNNEATFLKSIARLMYITNGEKSSYTGPHTFRSFAITFAESPPSDLTHWHLQDRMPQISDVINTLNVTSPQELIDVVRQRTSVTFPILWALVVGMCEAKSTIGATLDSIDKAQVREWRAQSIAAFPSIAGGYLKDAAFHSAESVIAGLTPPARKTTKRKPQQRKTAAKKQRVRK